MRLGVEVKGKMHTSSPLSRAIFLSGQTIPEFPFTMTIKVCVIYLEALMQFHVNLNRKFSECWLNSLEARTKSGNILTL